MMLGEIADLAARGAVASRPPEHLGLARAFVHQAEQHFDQCGFARSVGPQESKDLAPVHAQANAREGLDLPPPKPTVPVSFRQVASLNGERIEHDLPRSSGSVRIDELRRFWRRGRTESQFRLKSFNSIPELL